MKLNLFLYLIADADIPTRLPFLQIIEEALQGGVQVVQLRSKKKTTDEFLKIARPVHKLTTSYHTLFIINDSVQVAYEIDADGVHLGQGDLPVDQARKFLGPKKIIGVSTHTLEEARDAERKGVDYIGVGTVFPTASKDDIRGVIGTTGLMEIRKDTKLPIVGIGGIDLTNVASVLAAGADGIAVISAIMKSDNPKEVAQHFRMIIDRSKQKKTT